MIDSKLSNPKDFIGSGKIPLHLVPSTINIEVSMAYLEGALKYGRYNWRIAGVRSSIYYDALMRHMSDWWNGQDADPTTRVKHLASAVACLGILLDAQLCGKLEDDRPPAAPIPERIDELKETVAHLKEMFKDHNPKHYTIADNKTPDHIARNSSNEADKCAEWKETDVTKLLMSQVSSPDSFEPEGMSCKLLPQTPEGIRFEHEEIIRGHVIQIIREGEGYIDGERYTGRALMARIEMFRAGYDTVDEMIAALKNKEKTC